MGLRSDVLRSLCVAALLCVAARTTVAQDSNGVLRPAKERKAAPQLALEDSAGKQLTLNEYRGRVLVLDFWATWCHGCKEEIPWFAEFQRKYGEEGLTVVGVSLDEDGWKVVKPFIKAASVPYRIVLGNDGTAKAYGIGNMPDTFLIDRDGRIAATYIGMADKKGLEKNIETLLAKEQ
jgi:peroxiredoxin